MTAGNKLPFLTGKGTVIDQEFHGQGGLVNFNACQGFRLFRIRNGIADLYLAQANQRHNIAGLHFGNLCAFQSLIGVQAANFFNINFIFVHERDLLSVLNGSANHAADYDTAYIGIVVQGVGQHLQRLVNFHVRSGNGIQNDLEQRFQIVALVIHGQFGKARASRRIHHRELQLFVIRLQFNEQVQHFIHYFRGALVRTVNFIDDYNRFQMFFQCLAKHILRLGHRAFIGVYQQQHAVHHGEDAFHFPAEIRMAGRIQNIDLGSVVHNGCVFG